MDSKVQGLAELYQWDGAEKLIWLDCKLMGQERLTLDANTHKDFETIVEALTRVRARSEETGVPGEGVGLPELGKKGKDSAIMAENLRELAIQAHLQSEDLRVCHDLISCTVKERKRSRDWIA